MTVRIGTRGSKLALWQANHVAELLRPFGHATEIVTLQTTGDVNQSASLHAIGGQGAFTREIQTALLNGTVDVAVHSLKDLPTEPVAGLVLAAVPGRESTADAFIGRGVKRFDDLPQGATVGTGSPRRRAQLWHRRPDLNIVDMRGNVDTRLRKLEGQRLDAIVLAVAGLRRLGWAHRITEELDVAWMLPAVGQGALGLECRADDNGTRELLAKLNDAMTMACVKAERAFLRQFGSGCALPIAALAMPSGPDQLWLRGVVLSVDGKRRHYAEGRAEQSNAETIGRDVARSLLEQGAGKLLEQAHAR